jgi:MOSC domain-containing protein YiiM
VGQPASYGSPDAELDHHREWTTGFFKLPVAGPVWASRTNLAGDGQADLKNHGGIHKAILAYSADHYAYWRRHLSLSEMPYAAFGENLTIAGLDEQSVAIGDVWQAGSVVLQVSQPRQPCWKLTRRWQLADLAQQVIANGKSGWYLRVRVEGELKAGDALALIERPHPEWTVARANQVMHHARRDLAAARTLAELPELSPTWQRTLSTRANRHAQ